MKNIIILTQGENIHNLPLNTKTFIYLAEKYNINYEILSQKKVVYFNNKYIIRKLGKINYYKLKILALLKLFFPIKQKTLLEEISKIIIGKKINYDKLIIKNIKFVDNLNEYLITSNYKNSMFISFGAPIIKKKTITNFKNYNSILLNSHIGTSNYPGITPYIHALLNKNCNNIGLILHEITPEIDKGNIYLEKKLDLKIYKNILNNITDLVNTLLIFSAYSIFKFLTQKEIILKPIKNNLSINKSYFIVNYFQILKANYYLKKCKK